MDLALRLLEYLARRPRERNITTTNNTSGRFKPDSFISACVNGAACVTVEEKPLKKYKQGVMGSDPEKLARFSVIADHNTFLLKIDNRSKQNIEVYRCDLQVPGTRAHIAFKLAQMLPVLKAIIEGSSAALALLSVALIVQFLQGLGIVHNDIRWGNICAVEVPESGLAHLSFEEHPPKSQVPHRPVGYWYANFSTPSQPSSTGSPTFLLVDSSPVNVKGDKKSGSPPGNAPSQKRGLSFIGTEDEKEVRTLDPQQPLVEQVTFDRKLFCTETIDGTADQMYLGQVIATCLTRSEALLSTFLASPPILIRSRVSQENHLGFL
eukprot:gene30526-39781_t